MTLILSESHRERPAPITENFVDLLRLRATSQAAKFAYVFLEDGEREGPRLTFADLDRRARAIAARLVSLGLRGERVLLLYPQGLSYIEAFFGCLYAGVVAVPAYPPSGRHIQRLQSIFRDATPSMVLTTAALRDRFEKEAETQLSSIACGWMATDEINDAEADLWDGYAPDPDQIAFLQYTSGSTGVPRGVMITHANLLSNQALIKLSFAHDERSDLVGWLPLYHDMGLIGNILQPLYVGATAYLMSPMAFLERPLRWLKAISTYRAHTSGGPNFAFDLCVRKIKNEDKRGLDLASWRIAFSGAEPVRASTLERFADAFAGVGFSRASFFPCYGLAEATLVVTAPSRGENLPVLNVDRHALEARKIAPGGDDKTTQVVACGHAWPGYEVEIVDPETSTRCAENQIGEIWVRGPGVARGYWQRPDETAQTFSATIRGEEGRRYLRTGDLGFFSEGDCYVAGRLKDLIIVAGRNFYPHDIESAIEERIPGVRPGCSVAFSVAPDDEERLVIVLEPDRSLSALEKTDASELFTKIRNCVVEAVDVEPALIAFVQTGSAPKTSSGKIRRAECRKRFLSGELKILARSDDAAPRAAAASEDAAWSADAFIRETLSYLSRDRQIEAVTRFLITSAAVLLKTPESMIDETTALPRAGLSSLRAIEFKHRIDSILKVETPIGLLLSDAPLSALAKALADLLRDAAPEISAASGPSGNARLSKNQLAMWTVHHLDPASVAYNLHLALELNGGPNGAQVAEALASLMARHSQLRTVYRSTAEGVIQEVLPLTSLAGWFQEEDATGMTDAQMQAAMSAEARKPFALERQASLRVTLYRRNGGSATLLFVAHHIAVDLWSLLLLLTQFDAALRDEATRCASPASAEDYRDFVLREQAYLSSSAADADRAFWSKRLDGPLPILFLPERKPVSSTTNYSGGSVPLRIGSAATRRLMKLANERGASLNTLLTSIYFVLLHRLTGQTDLIVGAPTSGRLDRRSAALIGNCVNPVPIRLTLDRRDRFSDVLRRAQVEMREALEHQLFPFPALVEDLQPERAGDRLPVYQTWFVLQEAHGDLPRDFAALALGEEGARLAFCKTEARVLKLHHRIELFDLKVMAAELGEELLLSFQYRTQAFEREIVERFSRCYETLVDSILTDPDGAIGSYRLLDDGERRRTLFEWNATAANYPHNLCLHQLFEAQAARTQAVALIFEDQSLTYGELNARANQLAHRLKRLGVGPETVIGLCAVRSVEMVVGLIGVLKSGAAYLPLDPDNPDERLAFMIEDASAALVLTLESLRSRLPAAVPTLSLDAEWPSIVRESEGNPVSDVKPQNLAYVIYTSGSTGKPKGVAMAHAGVVNRIDWMQRRYRLCDLDVVLQKTPFGFDVSVWEFLWPLQAGARLALLSPDAHRDPDLVAKAIVRHGVTTIHFVPTMLQAFLGAVEPCKLSSLRRVICSGEELPAAIVQSFCASSKCELHNLYGPTEAAIDVSAHECHVDEGDRTPIGKPISNIELYILDANLEPVPIGVTGDLYVGGTGLARGYLKRPELTADRFVPHPFSETGERLYRTGDLARYRANGEIEFLGRSDHQVKVRGFRIELGEVESALSKLDGVAQAAVTVRAAHDEGNDLVGYVVGENKDVDALRAGLERVLPDYMIPHFIVALDEMPMTPNGKIDRKALPQPDVVASAASEYVAPASAEEAAIVEAFADALGLERVGARDSFFRFGGDSIRAIQVAARLRQSGYEITPRELFDRPTAAALASVLRRLDEASARAREAERALQEFSHPFSLAELDPEEIASICREHGDVEDIYPLTSMQEGMYFHALSHRGTGLYHMQERYEIRGALDVAAFAAAWQKAVDRHANLRTSFGSGARGRVHQIVHRSARLDVDVMAFDHLSPIEQDVYIDDLLRAERERGFDLSQAPLMRIKILKLSDDRHICVRSFHHIVMDDWCTSPLLLDVRQHYAAALRGAAPETKPAGRFHDYLAWLRIRDLTAAEDFWRAYLEGFSEPTPLVGARGPERDAAVDVGDVIVQVSAESYKKLKALAQQNELTINTFVQGALALLLSSLSGREEVVFGVTVSGRPVDLPGVESTLGLFINGLPLRVKLQRDAKVLDWLKKILSDNLEMRQHEFLSQSAIQRCSAIPRADGLLFQHLLTFENAPIDPSLRGEKDLLDIDLLQLRVHTNYPLTFVAIPDDALTLRLTYDRERFDASLIEDVAARFKRAVEELATKSDRHIRDLSLLSGEERAGLYDLWRGLDRHYGSPLDFVDRFEAQAARDPSAVAASCEGAALSYGEVNARANALAHALAAEGVGPETLVALLDSRGLDFLGMILAVFKAGGAYLPLDPAHPDGRIAQALRESRAAFLLAGRNAVDRASALVAACDDAPAPPKLLDLAALQAQGFAAHNPRRRHGPGNLAFVIYTSGSTGKPKGAMVEHRGMFNNLITKVPALGLTQADVVAQTASQCFDISVWQFLTALAIGARVEIFPDAISRDPERLAEAIAQKGVTILEAVPSMIRALLDASETTPPLAGLRWLLPCGEAFAPELCRRFMARYPQVRLLNAYGPAECSDDVSYHAIETPPPGDDLSVPIGRAVDNTQLYVLDRWLEPSPIGVAGEICVAGAQVGRGYLNRPDLTAAAFLPDPYGPPGGRLYRTGDLGRYRADGVLDFLGRVDHQVKIRGHRIEPGEVEAALATHPKLRAAAVVAREASPGVYRLVAYVVGEASADELRRHLQETLPDYMIPSAFVSLEALPLTANGKVDRKALPAPDLSANHAQRYVAPRNEVEEKLARIWADVLRLPKVGVFDNFFELGGHSLLATQIASRVRSTFGVQIPLRSLFEARSVAEMAEVVEVGLEAIASMGSMTSGSQEYEVIDL